MKIHYSTWNGYYNTIACGKKAVEARADKSLVTCGLCKKTNVFTLTINASDFDKSRARNEYCKHGIVFPHCITCNSTQSA